MISLKIYKQGEDTLIAACDLKLMGKEFTEGKFILNVSKKFYEGEHVDIDVLKKHLETATIANLVGEETINFAVENDFIDAENVLKIKGIPHVQMVKMI
ncbi:MAG: DUF424 family protein [Candidatus Thermoplasmatota archaeon]